MPDETPDGNTDPQPDPSELERIPVSYQELHDYFKSLKTVNPYLLRRETMKRIEEATGRPLICYATKTHNRQQNEPTFIDDGDLTGFQDLVNSVDGQQVDVFLISNGGSPESTERIVRLIRDKFESVRFVIPGNAFSAATLMCFAGDEILMDQAATLGPIDPQLNGVPARAIRRAIQELEKRLKQEGPGALTVYMPLIAKYDLHTLEICKSAQELSEELARCWLSTYMLKCDEDDERVKKAVKSFASYDVHKSHGRSIDRAKAAEFGLVVNNMETPELLAGLVRSLYNQYEIWFDKTTFFKMYENTKGINWGRQVQSVTVQMPVVPQIPQNS